MYRRRFLGTSVCITGLSGCLFTGGSDDEHEPEGTKFISLGPTEEFSGVLRIVPHCREGEVEITFTEGRPDKPIPYVRKEYGDSCSFDIFLDEEYISFGSNTDRTIHISGTESGSIEINEDGELDVVVEIL